jgi:thiamine-phosphate pyrophosphorylase
VSRTPLLDRPLICYVTNRRALAHSGVEQRARLLALVAGAARGGVDFVQVRERDLDAGALVRLVRECLVAVEGTRCRVLVNDRLDVAVAGGAAGVHLRGDSVPARRARVLVGPTAILGRSVHSVDDMRTLGDADPVDYLTFGTVFSSASKEPGQALAGASALAAAVRATSRPVLAIGGITSDTITAVAEAGAAGFAAIGFFQGSQPAELPERISSARQKFDTLRRRPYDKTGM